MKRAPKPPKGEIRVHLGALRDRLKIRCVRLGIPMHEGLVRAVVLWLKEGAGDAGNQ